jgi:SOS response regulatory protein OraA/RecX
MAVERGEVDLRQLLRRRIRRRLKGRQRIDAREYARVYNALLRAGFDSETVHQELEPHRTAPDPFVQDGTIDEFP